jgi:hypothetical protein
VAFRNSSGSIKVTVAVSGYETMNMIRKGQAKGADKGDLLAQVRFIDGLFAVAA